MATQTTATAKSARISNLRDHILAAAPKLPEELVHVADWDDADGTESFNPSVGLPWVATDA